jgi:hypothetical protein
MVMSLQVNRLLAGGSQDERSLPMAGTPRGNFLSAFAREISRTVATPKLQVAKECAQGRRYRNTEFRFGLFSRRGES